MIIVKVNFEKKNVSSRQQKHNYPACKELKVVRVEIGFDFAQGEFIFSNRLFHCCTFH